MNGLSIGVLSLSVGLISVAVLWGILYDSGRFRKAIALTLFGKLSLLVIHWKFRIFPSYDVLDYLPYFQLFIERQSLVTFFGIHVRAYTVLYPGWFFELFGETASALWMIRLSNVLLSTALLYPLNEIHKIVFDDRLSQLQAVLLLGWPSYLPFAIYVGRTQVSVFLLLLSILAVLRLVEETRLRAVLVATIVICLTTAIRIHYVFYPIILLILIIGYNSPRYYGRRDGTALLVMVGGPVGAVAFATYQRLATMYFGEPLSVSTIAGLARTTAEGGSAYLVKIYPSGFPDLVWYLPLQGVYFLFSPFPWQLAGSDVSPLLVVTVIETVLFTGLVGFAITSRRDYLKQNPTLLVLLGTILFTGMGFGLGVKNAGGAHRWRMPLQLLLVMIATSLLRQPSNSNNEATTNNVEVA